MNNSRRHCFIITARDDVTGLAFDDCFAHTTNIGGHGVVAVMNNGPGKTLLIRGHIWGLNTRKPLVGVVLDIWQANEKGRYESGTLNVINSSNPGFTAAVKDALPRMKFSAAQIGGKKVQQLVQMPFQFHLTH